MIDSDRFVSDTVDDGPARIDGNHAPPTPADLGPGRWVRESYRLGWQWEGQSPILWTRPRWVQPPAGSDRPILVAHWSTGSGMVGASPITGRMYCEHDRVPIGDHTETVISIRLARCDVATWDEARSKDDVGQLILQRPQSEYLRDALTAMLARPVP